jgi:hypothetical protein
VRGQHADHSRLTYWMESVEVVEREISGCGVLWTSSGRSASASIFGACLSDWAYIWTEIWLLIVGNQDLTFGVGGQNFQSKETRLRKSGFTRDAPSSSRLLLSYYDISARLLSSEMLSLNCMKDALGLEGCSHPLRIKRNGKPMKT